MEPKRIVQTVLDENDDLSEFLLEEEEKYISLQEAIQLASDEEIVDVVVCHPKKGKPYLRAKGDKTKRNNLRSLAVKPTCGPEIGRALVNTLHRVQQTFEKPANKGGWSDDRKADACNSLDRFAPWGGVNAANSWDISQLYDAGTGEAPLLLNYSQCAKLHSCQDTVMVFGHCHKAPVVNYVLFGFLWNLCRTGYPLAVLEQTSGYAQWKDKRVLFEEHNDPRDFAPEVYREEYYTLDHALTWTSDYKAFVHSEDRPLALDWVGTGFSFHNWINNTSSLTPR